MFYGHLNNSDAAVTDEKTAETGVDTSGLTTADQTLPKRSSVLIETLEYDIEDGALRLKSEDLV